MRRSSILFGIAVTMLASALAHAQQPRSIQIGVLECRGGASVGFIVGSVTNLGCLLHSEGRPDQPYVATIRKVGIDLGITEQSSLAWAVFAPVERAGVGDLSGNYAGAQGSANIGIGLGANVLVCGSANSRAWRPLGIWGSTGISVAVGLAGMELRPGR